MNNVRLSFPDTPDALLSVRSFRVEESMSGLFEIAVVAVTPNVGLSLSAMVGHRASFSLTWSAERNWHGYCDEAKFVRVSEAGDGLASFEFRVRPELYRLGERINNRLFQHLTIPAIVTSILRDWQIAHSWQIAEQHYPALELRMQYGESDLAFISRLLEEAGISYWFSDDELVLGDAPQSNDELVPPIPFLDDPTQARASRLPFLTKVTLREGSRPGRVTLRDYDPTRARVPLYARADAQRGEELAHEQFHFAPGSFLSESRTSSTGTPVADDLAVARHSDEFGAIRARRTLEALHSDRRTISFDTSVNDLAPGCVFRLANHPRIDLGPAESFLVTEAVFQGEVAHVDEWRFHGKAVSTSAVHRPKARTPKPRIVGIQTAVVVGPTGPGTTIRQPIGGVGELATAALDTTAAVQGLPDNDIYVDEHGRVRVQFPWDRDHAFSSQSSIWMRVSQGWAGNGYGVFTVPRVGHEVLVAFMDGDPDCPLIVGRAHNAAQPVPFPLPANKTVSTWKTASSPGGGGFNELRFDDAQQREHVFLQAQKDMDTLVKNDAKRAVGNNDTAYVQREATTGIGGGRTHFVNHDDVDVVGMNKLHHVAASRLSHVGIEDRTLVGNRWAVAVASDLSVSLPSSVHAAASSLADALRTAAVRVLGTVPTDPLTSTQSSPLARFGEHARHLFRDVAGVLTGVSNSGGPPPTSITMVDRRIELTTGEASIILDGPNITLRASGHIAVHAAEDAFLLADRELAVGAIGRVAIASGAEEVVVQAHKDLHLNPFPAGPGIGAPAASRTPAPREADSCEVCGATKVAGACPALGAHTATGGKAR